MRQTLKTWAETAFGAVVATGLALAILLGTGATEVAAQGMGQPVPYGINLQASASPFMTFLTWFHTYIFAIITVIVLFVLALLIYVVVRFNEKANPTPSKTTHHVGLEVAWTIVPIFILIAISIPSFRLLMTDLQPPKADMHLKITGKQWFWSYEYPDHGKFSFDQIMMTETEIADAVKAGKAKAGELPRLLAVDNEIVVPVNKVVHIAVTAADVIHSFTVPSFGVKIDAIPGRLNHAWFKAEKEGVFYGQCSELCGKDHAFMPIAVRVVSEDKFNAWVAEAKKKFASGDVRAPSVAEIATTTVTE